MIYRIPVLKVWFERRGRRRVAAIMRGYRSLKAQQELGRISDVREALANTKFGRVSDCASTLVFGATTATAEKAVRQYLLARIAYTTLSQRLLAALARPGGFVMLPLPAEWREVVRAHGFRVAPVQSALLWHGYIVLLWGQGLVAIGRRLAMSAWSMLFATLLDPGRYAFFNGIGPNNLPQPGTDGRSHDIMTWYVQWPGRIPDLQNLCHGVKGAKTTTASGIRVVAMESEIPPVGQLGRLVRFGWWGCEAATLAACDVLRGRWWHALMLAEASKAALVRGHKPHELARDYLFHNSDWIYRPLWTYDAEMAGSRIVFYFYSTNCEPFKRPERDMTKANGWHITTWPLYLVWDHYQADFIRHAVGDHVSIQVVGPIWFSGSDRKMPAVPARSIAVFDVQPVRNSWYQQIGAPVEYYTPGTANRFLLDISEATVNCGGTIVLKRKRNIGTWVHPQYARVIERLSRSGHFIAVEPDTDAVRVIEQCGLTISMPFTSTAVLARTMGKPSAYYDPHGVIQKDDRAAHGIPVVTGPAELVRWVSSNLERIDPTAHSTSPLLS